MKQFEKIDLSADLYRKANEQNKTFTEALEEIDPSGDYPDSTLDAFERQMAVRGLVVRGKRSLTAHGQRSVSLEVMYDKDNRVLFPELISRTVRKGLVLGRNSVNLDDIVAVHTPISGEVVKQVKFDTEQVSASRTGRRRVAEGGKFPLVTVSTGDKTIQARKFGRLLKISSEARRRMSVDLLLTGLEEMALQWGQDMVADAVNTLLSGASSLNTAASGTLAFADVLGLSIALNPYEGGILVADAAGCKALLGESNFRDTRLTDMNTSGVWPTVLGANVRLSTVSGLSNKILAVDPRFALEQVTEEGSMIQEEEHVIDGQWDKVAISIVTGFARIFDRSVKTLNTVWS
ncbi:MAG: hypothetical protein K8R90_05205 [Candidatus Cloacimonetes bacterium]|nr:hypothetical protein [Candidatus Cloacimonadota bacterium]